MREKQYVSNIPAADILINSLRSMGYSFESAIADIVDNSISVKAKLVHICFPYGVEDKQQISIVDNGAGMEDLELLDAMKFGSTYKTDFRDSDDLGRFGLGLKTASISQCKKFTVISKKNGFLNGYVWDLDDERTKNWELVKLSEEDINSYEAIEDLNEMDSGTAVIWENFDVLEKECKGGYAEGTSEFRSAVFDELKNRMFKTGDYLSLVFHRYISSKKISIKINNTFLKAKDPFLTNNPKTNILRESTFPVVDKEGIERIVRVQPYILPFNLTKDDYEELGGIENFISSQGFYLYRNQRLIYWGDWFGAFKGDRTKYARVQIDIPNSLDDIFGIDIRKQKAKLPSAIKKRLAQIIEESRMSSLVQATYKGKEHEEHDGIKSIWKMIELRDDERIFKINRDSIIFDLLMSDLTEDQKRKLNLIINEIEDSIPIGLIQGARESAFPIRRNDQERINDLVQTASILAVGYMNRDGLSKEEAINKVVGSAPFNAFDEVREKLWKEI